MSDFGEFEKIKHILKANIENINNDGTGLVMLFLGFCNHLVYYMDAYKVLFNSRNYYVCKTMERAVIDLFIKARCLLMAQNTEEFARKLIDTGKISKNDLQPETIKDVSTTRLCEYFDAADRSTIDPIMGGPLTRRFRDCCKYVHPNMPCIWSYTTDKQNNWQTIIEDDKEEFISIAYRVNTILSLLVRKIHELQVENS